MSHRQSTGSAFHFTADDDDDYVPNYDNGNNGNNAGNNNGTNDYDINDPAHDSSYYPSSQSQSYQGASPHPNHPQNYEDDDDLDPSNNIPRYARATDSSHLPQYINAEAEMIKQSFSRASYRMLAHLPTNIKPHTISRTTQERIDENLTSTGTLFPPTAYGTYKRMSKSNAVFSAFEYIPEKYSLISDLSQLTTRQQAILDNSASIQHPKPFLYSTPRPLLINGLAGKPSYEHEAQYIEVYEEREEERKRQLFLEKSKILHGPFLVNNGERALAAPQKSALPEILSCLLKEIDSDWGDSEFILYVDDDDIIIVQFNAASVDSTEALTHYMNLLEKNSETVSKYRLTKLIELWNFHSPDASQQQQQQQQQPQQQQPQSHHPEEKELTDYSGSPASSAAGSTSAGVSAGAGGGAGGGNIYFAFRPPWVHRNKEDPWKILHPEVYLGHQRKLLAEKQQQRLMSEQQQQQQQQQQQLTATGNEALLQHSASASTTHHNPQQPQSHLSYHPHASSTSTSQPPLYPAPASSHSLYPPSATSTNSNHGSGPTSVTHSSSNSTAPSNAPSRARTRPSSSSMQQPSHHNNNANNGYYPQQQQQQQQQQSSQQYYSQTRPYDQNVSSEL